MRLLISPVWLLVLAACGARGVEPGQVTPAEYEAVGGRPAARARAPFRPGMHVLDAYLAHRIRELERRSPQLHATNAAIRRGDLPVYITTPDRIDEVPATASALLADRLGGRVGELAAFRIGRTDSIFMIVVRVDVERLAGSLHAEWLRAGYALRGAARFTDMHRAVDAVLIHELWGHLAPLAATIHLRGRCADPEPEQDPLASCVMLRENELRASLGLPRRTRYTW